MTRRRRRSKRFVKPEIDETHRIGGRITVILRGRRQPGEVVAAFGHHWILCNRDGVLEEPGEHASRSSGLGKTYIGDGEYRWVASAVREVG